MRRARSEDHQRYIPKKRNLQVFVTIHQHPSLVFKGWLKQQNQQREKMVRFFFTLFGNAQGRILTSPRVLVRQSKTLA